MNRAPAVFGKCSDAGSLRELNEDDAAVVELYPHGGEPEKEIVVAVVADGMGGHSAGEVASWTAVETVVETTRATLCSDNDAEVSLVAALDIAFREANTQVHQAATEDAGRNGMGTTLTAALISGHSLCIGHVGDSRAYLVREGQVRQLTRDHSVVQEKIDAGLITAEEARLSEERNQLRRVVGTQVSVLSDIVCADLKDGDMVLLCTDGLHNGLTEQDIVDTLVASPHPQAACDNLVAQAKRRDGSDNITAVCVGIGMDSPRESDSRLGRSARPRSRRVLGLLLGLVIALMGFVLVHIWEQWGLPSKVQEPLANQDSGLRPTPSAIPAMETLTLNLEVESGRARILQPTDLGTRLVTVADHPLPDGSRSADGINLPKRYLPARDQLVTLSFSVRSSGKVTWELSRRESIMPHANYRGLWVDGRLVHVTEHHTVEARDGSTAGTIVSTGVAPLPKTDLTFYLAGAQAVPVTVQFAAKVRGGNTGASRLESR